MSNIDSNDAHSNHGNESANKNHDKPIDTSKNLSNEGLVNSEGGENEECLSEINSQMRSETGILSESLNNTVPKKNSMETLSFSRSSSK